MKIISCIEKSFQWIKESNRWKHLLYGIILGLFPNSWYCSLLIGTFVAGAVEFKDWQWGGKPDIWDFLLTFIAVQITYFCKILLIL